MTMYRQGDVLIRRINTTIPSGLKPVPRDNGRVVLAYGEVTGHAHAITDPSVGLYAQDITDLTRAFMEITGDTPVELRHEEHSTIVLEPGVYEVKRQREYAPEAPVWVAD